MKRVPKILTLFFISLSGFSGAASAMGVAPVDVPGVPTWAARVGWESTAAFLSVLPEVASQTHNRTNPKQIPHSVSFREAKGQGLLVKVWVNGTGPYTFAIDTGAGMTFIVDRIASTLEQRGTSVAIVGLSGKRSNDGENGRETIIRSLAIGDSGNFLASNQRAVIISTLPSDIDGILDPTEAYLPAGCIIDLPRRELAAFNPRTNPLNSNRIPEGGTVVRWLVREGSNRPFIRLQDGRVALLDTGSGFGLGVSQDFNNVSQRHSGSKQDLGGGQVRFRRGEPSTITIGALTLRSVPTDILFGVEKDAPVLLGRDALYPFRLTFDPVQRLIEIAPAKR